MLGVLCLLGALQVGALSDTSTITISLEAAARRAVEVSPVLHSAEGEVRRARGARAGTWLPFPSNPTVELSRTQRRAPGVTSYDREWAVSQEIEVAGQWALRRLATSARVRAREAGVADVRRLVALDARRAYVRLAVAERRAALTDSAAAFADRLATFAQRQYDAGELNRLELNTAVLERGRARSVAERAEASRLGASAELRRVLALPSDSIPRTEALPSTPTLGSPEFARLAVFARERRPDLVAAEADLLGARRGMTVARLGLVPNLRVSALGGEEGGSDHLRGIGIGLTIPLFYRGEAERGVAAADLATAEAVAVDVARRIDAELAASLAAYVRAHSAERRFTTEVLASASANVALTERALAEGEVGLTEVLLLRGTALGAQLEYLDVLTNNYEAWFELAAALGVEPSELPGLLGVPEN